MSEIDKNIDYFLKIDSNSSSLRYKLKDRLGQVLLYKPESRAWLLIFTAIATLLSTVIVKFSGSENSITFIISPLLAGAFVVIFDFFSYEALSNHNTRLRIDSRAKFEGVYFEYIILEDRNLYAGFSIKYTGLKDESYTVIGHAYHEDGRLHAQWNSKSIKFNVIENTLEYFYQGSIGDADDKIEEFAHFNFQVLPGYIDVLGENDRIPGSTSAITDDKTVPHSGQGYLADNTPGGPSKTRFQFIRMTSPIMREVLQSSVDCKNFEIERYFVKRFHEKYGKQIRETGYLCMT